MIDKTGFSFRSRYRVLISLLGITIGHLANAQNVEQLRSVFPPSPTASSLGKYADWPVNLYTGVPGINVPLYTVQGRRMTVPITLNYHASGIKVSEIASWVGLGFSLDAGGVITRSVLGLPDDNGGYLLLKKAYSNPGDFSSPNISSPIIDDNTYFQKAADGLVDSEPDYYMFSALGKSYKLFFKGDGTIATLPASNIKFTYNDVSYGQELYQWKVTMEDGTQLIFGNNSVDRITNAQYGSSQNGVFTVISSWYLNKIISTEGEEVKFSYGTESVEQSVSYSETDYAKLSLSSPTVTGKKSIQRTRSNVSVLRKIETATDSVVFTTAPRTDLEGGGALKEIKIYSVFTGELVKKFLFNQRYSKAVNSQTFSTLTEDYKYRLKLIELKEVSPDNSLEKVWSFSYNPKLLPSRTSLAQDHWGYFNDATNNSTLLPFNVSFDPINVAYANREPDSTAVTAEMLTRITYPTGGYSEFNFESNSVIEPQDHYQSKTSSLNLTTTTQPVHIHKAQPVSLSLTGGFHDYLDYGGPSNGTENVALATLKIKQGTNTVIALAIRKQDVSAGGGVTLDKNYLLDVGDYTAEITTVTPDIITTLYGSIRFQEFTGRYNSPRLTGGVRVKSIFDYDNQTDKVIKRFFKYDDPFEIHPISLEEYVSNTTFRLYSCSTSGLVYDEYQTRIRFSGLRGSLGSVQGGAIGYSKVTTLYGAGGVNGKTISYFSSDADGGAAEGTVLPFPPVTDRGYKRGLLQKQEEYSAAGTLLKRLTNTYEFVDKGSIKAFKAAYKFTNTGSCLFYEFPEQVFIRSFYSIGTHQLNHIKSVETNFVLNASNVYDSLQVTKNYFYETPGNMLATRIETTDSEGRLQRTLQRTAMEKTAIASNMTLSNAASLAIDSLIRKNRISEVLQVENQVNGVLTSRQTTLYKIWSSNNPSIVQPESVLMQIGAGPVETRILFANYDAKGNLLEQLKSNDVNHTYLYDYALSKPIAEITNAKFNDVAYTSFEADGTGNWTVSSVTRNNTEANSGTKSYSLSGGNTITKSGLTSTTSYRLSFWAKGGSVLFNNTAFAGTDRIANGWTYYEKIFTSLSTITISGTAIIDEVRLSPQSAIMSTATYQPAGVTSLFDGNGKGTYYFYDGLNRVNLVKDYKGNIIKSIEYNYQLR